jgi:hypothetical protein
MQAQKWQQGEGSSADLILIAPHNLAAFAELNACLQTL